MFSNLSSRPVSLATALILSVSLFLGACARVGEDPPPQQERGLESTQCLGEASRVMAEFVHGIAQTDEVGGAWNCFGRAFEAFYKYVRGSSRDSYTPQELATYLEQNFFDKADKIDHIPVGLQVEFMKFKQIFVGGGRDLLTRNEVLAIAQTTRALGKVAQRLNPYMKVYLMKWETNEARHDSDLQHFENANTAVRDAAVQLSTLIQKSHDPYKLNDIVSLVDQLSKFLGQTWPATEQLRKFMPVAQKVKQALAGGDEGQIVASEWRRIFLLGGRAYVQYLRYHYFIEKDVDDPTGTKPFPVEYVARAVEDTFSILEDMVREKPGGVVSRAEVIAICEALSKAWPAFKYSDDLISEIMKVKQALLGGTLQAFSVKDFENARLKTSDVKVILTRLIPFSDIYLGKWKIDLLDYAAAIQKFGDARSAFDASLKQLGGLIESGYNINSISALIGEFERLYPPQDPDGGYAQTIKTYVPLIVEFKNLLYADQDAVVKKEQWPSFLNYGAGLFDSFRFYGYFLKGQSDQKIETYQSMQSLVDQVRDLVQNILIIRAVDVITTAEVKSLVLQLQRVGVIPRNISPDTIGDVLNVIVNRILNPPDRRLGGDLPNGIRKATIDYVYSEVQGWIQTQEFLVDVFANSSRKTVTPSSLRKQIGLVLKDPATSPELKEALTGLNIAVGGDLPFVVDQAGRLIVSRRLDPDYNFESLKTHNLIREITRIFLASYAESASRVRKSVVASEAERAFKELKGVAIDYGILDPANTAFMTNRFREANLFMPRSDGDQTATFAEVHELVYAILSGIKLNDQLRPALLKECPTTSRRRRVAGSEKVDYGCLYRSYQKGFRTTMTSMPEFQKFQRAQSDDDFNAFFFNSLKGTGYVPSGNSVKLSDVALLPQLIQYIELIYARFDTNNDGAINVPEAKRAFPAFKEIFKILAKKELDAGTIKESDLIAVFTWVLKYGKPPSTIFEKLKFLAWKNDPNSWDCMATRNQISNILGYIADQLAPPKRLADFEDEEE